MIRFHRGYAALALALFAVEVLIALFVQDRFVRPYLGDTIAVILVYAALRAVLRIGTFRATAIALLIAFAVELGQYFHILDWLGLADNEFLRTVLGYGFEPADLIAYTAGAAIVLVAESWMRKSAPAVRP